ncbi:hypothetical protein KCU91_g129, partial [Aureobasidium melanogenum]
LIVTRSQPINQLAAAGNRRYPVPYTRLGIDQPSFARSRHSRLVIDGCENMLAQDWRIWNLSTSYSDIEMQMNGDTLDQTTCKVSQAEFTFPLAALGEKPMVTNRTMSKKDHTLSKLNVKIQHAAKLRATSSVLYIRVITDGITAASSELPMPPICVV